MSQLVTSNRWAETGFLLLMALIGTACGGGGSEAASSISQPAAQPSNSPTVAAPTLLPELGVIPPDNYAPLFQPKMTFTADATGWEVDVDTSGWLAMEYPLPEPRALGNMSIVAVEKVFDDKPDGKLIDPPKDLVGWIAKLPGLKVVAPPTPVTVGGIEGQQLDILVGPENVHLGPIPGESKVPNGWSSGGMDRIIEVRVDGQVVLISFGPEAARSKNFDAAVSLAQPLIDSIMWG